MTRSTSGETGHDTGTVLDIFSKGGQEKTTPCIKAL